jgi:hypothetical protein
MDLFYSLNTLHNPDLNRSINIVAMVAIHVHLTEQNHLHHICTLGAVENDI